MKIDAASLKSKGWTDHEIHHVLDVFKKNKEHPELKAVQKKIYLTVLIIVILFVLILYFSIVG